MRIAFALIPVTLGIAACAPPQDPAAVVERRVNVARVAAAAPALTSTPTHTLARTSPRTAPAQPALSSVPALQEARETNAMQINDAPTYTGPGNPDDPVRITLN